MYQESAAKNGMERRYSSQKLNDAAVRSGLFWGSLLVLVLMVLYFGALHYVKQSYHGGWLPSEDALRLMSPQLYEFMMRAEQSVFASIAAIWCVGALLGVVVFFLRKRRRERFHALSGVSSAAMPASDGYDAGHHHSLELPIFVYAFLGPISSHAIFADNGKDLLGWYLASVGLVGLGYIAFWLGLRWAARWYIFKPGVRHRLRSNFLIGLCVVGLASAGACVPGVLLFGIPPAIVAVSASVLLVPFFIFLAVVKPLLEGPFLGSFCIMRPFSPDLDELSELIDAGESQNRSLVGAI